MKTNSIGTYELGRVHHADCLEAMRELPDGCVQSCVTSPPYWGLRKYDVPDVVFGGEADCAHEWSSNGEKVEHERRAHSGLTVFGERGTQGAAAAAGGSRSNGSTCRICGAWIGQLGLEPTPDLYVSHMVGIFREVRRVLRDDGTLWLNIGDCYASTPAGNKTWNHGKIFDGRDMSGHHTARQNTTVVDGLKPKDLIGIPWLLAFALRADGWFLRAEIIWHKTAPMPESVRDRPTRAHEQVFLLSKSGTYFYDHEAARDPATRGAAGSRLDLGKSAVAGLGRVKSGECDEDGFRNWRTVWTIGPEPNNAQHYAPFPRELARRCIVAGSKAGGVVLDPFAGTGTTVRVADGLGRKAIGFDLGEKYVEQANERSGAVAPSQAKSGQQIGLLGDKE